MVPGNPDRLATSNNWDNNVMMQLDNIRLRSWDRLRHQECGQGHTGVSRVISGWEKSQESHVASLCLRANDDDDNVWENASSLMWASSRQSSSTLHHLYSAPDEESWWWSLSSYIHHWEKWMRNISLCFVSRSGKYIDSSHFQKLSQPTLKNVLWASSLFRSSDEWISVRSYLEPWEYPSPASSSVQT